MGGNFVNFKFILCCFLFLQLFAIFVLSNDIPNEDVKDDKQNSVRYFRWDDRRPPENRWRIPKKCPTMTNCSECVSFPCTWSVESGSCHKCSLAEDRTCKISPNNSTFITSVNKKKIKCPWITSKNQIIYVPSGSNKTIVVKVELDVNKESLATSRYGCGFQIENNFVEVNAFLLRDQVYCANFNFSYDSNDPKLSVPLFVLLGPNRGRLENPENISIEIFKCAKMAKSCKSCVSIEKNYDCGWCDKTNSCEHNTANCEDSRITRETGCK